MIIVNLTRVLAAAAVPRSAAKSPGTFAVAWRPRPSGRYRPWVTTFAPILISFSRRLVGGLMFVTKKPMRDGDDTARLRPASRLIMEVPMRPRTWLGGGPTGRRGLYQGSHRRFHDAFQNLTYLLVR